MSSQMAHATSNQSGTTNTRISSNITSQSRYANAKSSRASHSNQDKLSNTSNGRNNQDIDRSSNYNSMDKLSASQNSSDEDSNKDETFIPKDSIRKQSERSLASSNEDRDNGDDTTGLTDLQSKILHFYFILYHFLFSISFLK
jgi:hypothetical protein